MVENKNIRLFSTKILLFYFDVAQKEAIAVWILLLAHGSPVSPFGTSLFKYEGLENVLTFIAR